MAFFGQEFKSLGDFLRGDVVDLTRLQAYLNTLSGNQGAILYVPAGTFRIPQRFPPILTHYAPWRGDLDIPSTITLWFEQEGELRLENSRLVIGGGLVAPAQRIFREELDGLVLFAGEMPELLPEWWGATGDATRDDRDAIQRAIDAGSARRAPNGAHSKRPIPIRLQGRYTVSGPVVIGRVVPVPSATQSTEVRYFGFDRTITTTLRGTVSGTVRPSAGLFAEPRAFANLPPQPPQGRAVLHVEAAGGCLIEDLLIDGNGAADFGVVFDPRGVPEPGGTAGQMHSVGIRRCTVRGARRVQIQVGPPTRSSSSIEQRTIAEIDPDQSGMATELSLRVPVESGTRADGDVVGLAIQDCRIECPMTGKAADASSAPRGIQLRAGNGLGIWVSNCTFRGAASTFVDAVGIMALIEGCDFANILPTPAPAPPAQMVPPDLGFEPPAGQDVYLSHEPQRPRGDRVGDNAVLGYIAVTSCVSQSGALFGTVNPGPIMPKRPERGVLLLGCAHLPSDTHRAADRGGRFSVFWGRLRYNKFSPSSIGDTPTLFGDPTLTIAGCNLALPFAIAFGAAPAVLLATSSGNASRPSFVQARRAFTARTVVYGLQVIAALALLAACDRSGGATASDVLDVTDTPMVSDINDLGVAPRDVVDASDDALDASIADALDAADASDAATGSVRDGPDVEPYVDAGPPQQMRARCPASGVGDPTIAPPRLVRPMSPLKVSSRRPTLHWELPPGVTGARVELCRDRCCTQVIETFDADGVSGRPSAMLAPGVVFWRARGRVGDRVGRETSFTWEFGVRHRDTPTDTAWGTIRDMNGDGYDDLATSDTSAFRSQARVYLGGPDVLRADRYTTFDVPHQVGRLTVGDLNGDGLADIAIHSEDTSELGPFASPMRLIGYLTIVHGSAAGPVLRSRPMLVGRGGIAAGDLNGDGFGDVIAQESIVFDQRDQAQAFVIYGGPDGLQTGSRTFLPNPEPTLRENDFGKIPAVGDFDGDGYADVVFGESLAEQGRGVAYLFRGGAVGVSRSPDDTLRPPTEFIGGLRFGVRACNVGDLDGDGVEDLMFRERNRRAIEVFRGNRGTAPTFLQRLEGPDTYHDFGSPNLYRSGFGGEASSGGDVDGDGLAEIATACDLCRAPWDGSARVQDGTIYVYRMSRDAGLILMWTVYASGRYDGEFAGDVTAIPDLNGDGYADMVVANTGGDFTSMDRSMFIYPGGSSFVRDGGLRVYGQQLLHPDSFFPGSLVLRRRSTSGGTHG